MHRLLAFISEVKVSQLCPTLCYPMDSSMEFSRPKYWSGLPFLSQGDLLYSGIKPRSPALQADSLPAEPQGKPQNAFIRGSHSWHLQCRKRRFNSWVRKIPWRQDRLSTPVFLGFPAGSDGKESTCNVGDLGSVPGLGRSLGGGLGIPLQYSCLEIPHGKRSLAGYSPWGHKESDMTEWLSTAQHSHA